MRSVSFITIPVFTRIFSPADYGIMESIIALMTVIVVIGMLGLESASQRSFFDYTSDQVFERTTVISTAFWTLVTWCTILGVAGFFLSDYLSNLLFGNSSNNTLLLLALMTVPLTVLITYVQSTLNLWLKSTQYVIASFVGTFFTVGGSIYLAAVLKMGLFGYCLGVLIGSLAALVVNYGFIYKGIRFVYSFRELRIMLVYSLPLVPTSVFTWAVQSADRFFLLRYAAPVDVGLYSLGLRLSNVLLLMTAAFATAWSPFILDLHNRSPEEEPLVRARVLNYVALALAFSAMCLSVFAREILLILASADFIMAYQVVGLLAWRGVITGMILTVMTGFSISRQTHYFLRGTLLSAVINTVFNFVMIPRWGMYGAAFSILLSYACLFGFYLLVSQRLTPAPYKYKKLMVILVSAIVLTVIGTFVSFNSVTTSLIIKFFLVFCYPAILLLFGGLTPKEISTLGEWLANRVRQYFVR